MQWKSVPANESVPSVPEKGVIYRWEPYPFDPRAYGYRVDRNIGWISTEEQERIRSSVVGIAGCGGMGGTVATTLARLGVGHVRIADNERFELSNINRQIGASTETIGTSKAFTTARLIRAIAPDCVIEIFPEGIAPVTAETFAQKCSLLIDEIDFWAVGSRISLHKAARVHGVPLLVGSSVGFGTRLFFFDETSVSIEKMLCLGEEEAEEMEQVLRTGSGEDRRNARERVIEAMFRSLIPDLPDYRPQADRRAVHPCRERLEREGVASIVSTNPPFAAGLLANVAVLQLLGRELGYQLPRAPGYVFIDAATLELRLIRKQ